MPKQPSATDEGSALAEALAAVGDRWTLLVVEALLDGPARFNDLQEAVPGAPSRSRARISSSENPSSRERRMKTRMRSSDLIVVGNAGAPRRG